MHAYTISFSHSLKRRNVLSTFMENHPVGRACLDKILRYLWSNLTLQILINLQKERNYFDSGDFALAAGNRVTDNGAIQTGTAHPLRESISHPYAPVPNTSNVNDNANMDIRNERNRSQEMTDSPLHQRSNMGGGDPGSRKEQSKTSAMTDDIPNEKWLLDTTLIGSYVRFVWNTIGSKELCFSRSCFYSSRFHVVTLPWLPTGSQRHLNVLKRNNATLHSRRRRQAFPKWVDDLCKHYS